MDIFGLNPKYKFLYEYSQDFTQHCSTKELLISFRQFHRAECYKEICQLRILNKLKNFFILCMFAVFQGRSDVKKKNSGTISQKKSV